MNFWIQASNPKVLRVFDASDQKLSEAVETIFPMEAESAFIAWNHIYIPVSYKYDVSYMIDDILHMLRCLREKPEGKQQINWLPDTFAAEWHIAWNAHDVEIIANWRCVSGGLECLLNQKNILHTNKAAFLREWKMLLEIVFASLNVAGYAKLEGLETLYTEIEAISDYGILYK